MPSRTGLADLHIHTVYSDGTDTPRRIVELAKQAGLSAIAITDHDILDGYPDAAVAAQEHGIELIPGLEMSASSGNREVHVLGLLVALHHAGLQQLLAEQRARRLTRIHQMVGRLQRLGLAISAEDVFAVAGKGAVGRLHVAQALVRKGHVATPEEAFDRYIGNNGPAYIHGSPLNPQQAIHVIRQAGGIPVLAHPVYLKDDALIERLCQDGLVGLEVYHSSHAPEVVQRYERLADRLGLLKTGGTDYHGSAKEGVPIGAATVPYALVEALKQWKQQSPSSTCA